MRIVIIVSALLLMQPKPHISDFGVALVWFALIWAFICDLKDLLK